MTGCDFTPRRPSYISDVTEACLRNGARFISGFMVSVGQNNQQLQETIVFFPVARRSPACCTRALAGLSSRRTARPLPWAQPWRQPHAAHPRPLPRGRPEAPRCRRPPGGRGGPLGHRPVRAEGDAADGRQPTSAPWSAAVPPLRWSTGWGGAEWFKQQVVAKGAGGLARPVSG